MKSEERKLKHRLNLLKRSAEDFKEEYLKRVVKRTKKELIQDSLEIALVCELPFVVDKIDDIAYDTELLYACDPKRVKYSTWMKVIVMEREPRPDGNYDLFDTTNGNDVRTVVAELREAIEEENGNDED